MSEDGHDCGNPVRITTRFGDRERTNCGCGYVISDVPCESIWDKIRRVEADRDAAQVEVERLRAEGAAMQGALDHFMYYMFRYGNWDDGCFYYNSKSAPELVTPMKEAEKALASRANEGVRG